MAFHFPKILKEKEPTCINIIWNTVISSTSQVNNDHFLKWFLKKTRVNILFLTNLGNQS